jgi:hypothetical protein
MANCRSSYSSGGQKLTIRDLIVLIQAMTDQFPIDEVCAVIYGYPGKVFEGRRDKEVVITHADSRWISVHARDDRVSEG